MTIEPLPSGSYRIRQMDHGKLYTLTVKKKPTDRVARQLIDEKIAKDGNHDTSMSFRIAAKKYINVKSNILSPATIRGYNSMLRSMPDDFLDMDIMEIKTYDVQKLINDRMEDHSAKSVHNLNGFVLSVLRLFNPDVRIHTTLPQKPRVEKYMPTLDDVKKLMEYAQNSEYYVALRLAAMSLRRSEILALTVDDLDGNTLTINKSCVPGDNGMVIKNVPKTDASNRTITLSSDLADRIREQGYVYRNTPNGIDNYLHRALPKLGIPFFSVHKLRHFFASYSHDLGYSDAVIQSIGGWANSATMKNVYRHAMNEDESKQSMASDFKF